MRRTLPTGPAPPTAARTAHRRVDWRRTLAVTSSEEAAMPGSVIVASARTPIGKLSGALAVVHAPRTSAASPSRPRSSAPASAPEQVDYVFMGQVLQAGQGQITARQAAVEGRHPDDVPATTVNKVCLSGINAIYLADQMIQAGDADVVVAGGMESMTNAPYLLPGRAAGYRMGDGELVDSMIARRAVVRVRRRATWARAPSTTPASAASAASAQDELAAKSHERAAAAMKDGRFADEIVAGRDPAAQGRPDRRRDRRGRAARHHRRVARRARGPRSTRTAPSPPATLADLRRRRAPSS